MRIQRREIRFINKEAPEINQFTEQCGFDGQLEYDYEYEENEPLN